MPDNFTEIVLTPDMRDFLDSKEGCHLSIVAEEFRTTFNTSYTNTVFLMQEWMDT